MQVIGHIRCQKRGNFRSIDHYHCVLVSSHNILIRPHYGSCAKRVILISIHYDLMSHVILELEDDYLRYVKKYICFSMTIAVVHLTCTFKPVSDVQYSV